jgi:hypothetical protein
MKTWVSSTSISFLNQQHCNIVGTVIPASRFHIAVIMKTISSFTILALVALIQSTVSVAIPEKHSSPEFPLVSLQRRAEIYGAKNAPANPIVKRNADTPLSSREAHPIEQAKPEKLTGRQLRERRKIAARSEKGIPAPVQQSINERRAMSEKRERRKEAMSKREATLPIRTADFIKRANEDRRAREMRRETVKKSAAEPEKKLPARNAAPAQQPSRLTAAERAERRKINDNRVSKGAAKPEKPLPTVAAGPVKEAKDTVIGARNPRLTAAERREAMKFNRQARGYKGLSRDAVTGSVERDELL